MSPARHSLAFLLTSSLLSIIPAGAVSSDAVSSPLHETEPQGNQVAKWNAILERGENLAKGKAAWYSHAPNYKPFSKDGFERKLTDSRLSPREDGEIWFSEETVGWCSEVDQGVDILIDLGSEEAISKVAARFLGGAKQHSLIYPREISILLSRDGQTFHEVAKRVKVETGEKDLAELYPDKYFHFTERGIAFAEPMSLPVKARGRYVVLRIVGASSWLFLDELAVMKEAQTVPVRNLDDFPKAFFISDGVCIRPRSEDLVITTNLPTPNYLLVEDVRSAEDSRKEVIAIIDLPASVELRSAPSQSKHIPSYSEIRNRFRIKLNVSKHRLAGPFYFSLKKGAAIPEQEVARFFWEKDGEPANAYTVPLKAVEVPEVPPSATFLNASLAWMGLGEMEAWPEFFDAYRKLGFSIVPVFPHFWPTLEKGQAFVAQARKEGFRVVMNDSPFHRLQQRRKNQPEIFNSINGKQGRFLCPVYTGPYYKEEIERVARIAKETAPDFIFYDIETGYNSATEAKQCETCRKAFRESGKQDWDAFMTDQGTRMLADLRAATAGAAPIGQNPVVGQYNAKADPPVYHTVFDFQQLYPSSVALAQPSLYVQGNATAVGEAVRKNYDRLKSRSIVPYLTAGTYGSFPPYRLEQMILEAYLNGAGGITYYAFRDFDPMAFYYQANALSRLAPFAPILTQGKRLDVQCSNPALRCSAFGNDKEALLLVANYQNSAKNRGSLQFAKPVATAREIGPAGRMQELSPDSVEVAPDGHRLIHLEFRH